VRLDGEAVDDKQETPWAKSSATQGRAKAREADEAKTTADEGAKPTADEAHQKIDNDRASYCTVLY